MLRMAVLIQVFDEAPGDSISMSISISLRLIALIRIVREAIPANLDLVCVF